MKQHNRSHIGEPCGCNPVPASAPVHQVEEGEQPVLCNRCVVSGRIYCPPEHSQPPPKSIETLAGELAKEIYYGATNSRSELERLLIQFARAIKEM